jgi:hypothetical protein
MCEICDHVKKTYFNTPKDGDLRVWWIPQIPMAAFYYPVVSIAEAKHMIEMLGFYDMFQYNHKVKPDFSNVGGLHVYDSTMIDDECDGWVDWHNEDGYELDDVDDNGDPLGE